MAPAEGFYGELFHDLRMAARAAADRHDRAVEVARVPAPILPPDYVFYRELLWELEQHAFRGGTAWGAATVCKRVALEFGMAVEDIPLPRPSRAWLDAHSPR